MVHALVKTPEDQQAGPVSQAEHLVRILLCPLVGACLQLEHKSHVSEHHPKCNNILTNFLAIESQVTFSL